MQRRKTNKKKINLNTFSAKQLRSLSQPEILIKYQTVIPNKINHHRLRHKQDNIKQKQRTQSSNNKNVIAQNGSADHKV
ncbi:hypothetical protein VIGAN_02237700 [Vigna angularis var. angularis]|uniref:Uncharacterized protein n=1 Tax=Vigna angularis var. angularis TaxID=157739 RepID=A0A0S3RFR5_PHAAN|nr:hypothetical protein VIGAN_02237700 [Vigna angularis var. angularis]